jgi:phospholipid/cholesterol/gamma-HCH transport system substrate-binding protein
LKLYANTQAILGSNGLLGGKAITLLFPADKKAKILQNGDTLKPKKQQDMMAMITEKASPIITKTDSIMSKVDKLLGSLQGAGQKIDALLTDFQQITKSSKNMLQNNEVNIQTMLTNFAQLSQSLKETEKSLKPLLVKSDTLMNKMNKLELQATVQNATKAMQELNTMLAKINKGQGSVGALMNDEALYKNINASTQSLNKLMIDFRESPQRYVNISVFGKKNKEENAKKKEDKKDK